MKMKVKTQVTLELSGAEAEELAVWMYRQTAASSGGIVAEVWSKLSELPEEG